MGMRSRIASHCFSGRAEVLPALAALAQLLHQRRSSLVVGKVVDDEAGAGARQGEGDGAADPPRAARDYRDLFVQTEQRPTYARLLTLAALSPVDACLPAGRSAREDTFFSSGPGASRRANPVRPRPGPH